VRIPLERTSELADNSLTNICFHESPSENQRIKDVLGLTPKGRFSVLEIGARDGRISKWLATCFQSVTALDITKPNLAIKNVMPIQGDVAQLPFLDNAFDVVFCTEVLEHIPRGRLPNASREISRVARYEVVIGVPYCQDLRVGRMTCSACGRKNPPWGHVNSFDEKRLNELFRALTPIQRSFVGEKVGRTNSVSVLLFDLAGNPWGTYDQEEPCIHCGRKLLAPVRRTPLQRVCSGLAFWLNRLQLMFISPSPNWIHMVYRKQESVRPPLQSN